MFTPFAFVKSAAAAPAPPPSYITASAVALYDPILSYPGSGSTLYDLSPQGNNLVFNTKPGYVSQSVPVYSSNDGGRMQLTGSSYWYKCTTSGITTANNTSYTITTWFQPIISQSIMPGNPGSFIFLIGESSNGQGCYWGFFSGQDGNARVGVDLGGGSNTQMSLGPASAGNWYNLTYVLSGSVAKAYLNGMFVSSSSRGTVGFSAGANPITLGGIDGGDPCPDLNAALNGYVGFSAAYSVPLTDAEIEQNFDATKARYGL